MSNNAQFSAQIAGIIEGYKDKMDKLVRTASYDLIELIVRQTPVKTGFLRGSWYVSIGSPESANPGSGNTVATIGAALESAKAGDTIYFMNGAAYAMRLEFGFVGQDSLGRTYNQQPRAFVRSAVVRWPTIVAAAAQRLAGAGGSGGGAKR